MGKIFSDPNHRSVEVPGVTTARYLRIDDGKTFMLSVTFYEVVTCLTEKIGVL